MPLNFSHHPLTFPVSPSSEDNLLSSTVRIANGYIEDGIPEKNEDGFGKSQCFKWDIDDSFDYGKDMGDRGGGSCELISSDIDDLLPPDPFGMDVSVTFSAMTGWFGDFDYRKDMGDRGGDSCELISNDIVDILPSDPFGMTVSATFSAITRWFEGFEADSEDYKRDEVGVKKGDYYLLAGLNAVSNKANGFQGGSENTTVCERSNAVDTLNGWVEEKELVDDSCDCGFIPVCNLHEFLCYGDEDTRIASCYTKESEEGTGICSDGDRGAPHDGLLFALGYLSVQDLLSIEQVCKTLRSAVQSDALLWRNIHIDHPLSGQITDDALLKLTSRAEGSLQCLSLVGCLRITDDGLKRVLESNPRLKKLSVPRCTRLSIEGIVTSLKAFKSSSTTGITHLRIGGLSGMTHKHFEELKFLLGVDSFLQQKALNPRFYHSRHPSLFFDDDRALDIEMCPSCGNLRLIYDCPTESCQGKLHESQSCRACKLCIARCVQCGRCIRDGEYEEIFCLEFLCCDCLKQKILKSKEDHEENGGSSKYTIFHQETRYHFRLHV